MKKAPLERFLSIFKSKRSQRLSINTTQTDRMARAIMSTGLGVFADIAVERGKRRESPPQTP